jgi:uncharacterized membrane protein YhaH (DUF805 family)
MTTTNAAPMHDLWMGRSSRLEFWLSSIVLLSVHILREIFLHDAIFPQLLLFPIWLYIAARRLHDFNASAMWGWSMFLLGFSLGILERTGLQIVHHPVTEQVSRIVLFIATISLVVIIGSVPGTKGQNRFGPAKPRRSRDVSVNAA